MTNFPDKTCTVDRLVRHPKLVEFALKGQKTQQRRDGVYAYPGERFELKEVEFLVTALERKSLGEMTEIDAKAEGYPDLESYKELILKMHPNMQWDGSHLVWVHHFRRIE